MSGSREIRELFMPWAGLVAGIAGAGIAHQFGAEGTFDSCTAISPVPILIVSLACIVLVAAGALGSWRVFREDLEAPARKLIAVISLACSALFVLAILLPMIASLVIPPCVQ